MIRSLGAKKLSPSRPALAAGLLLVSGVAAAGWFGPSDEQIAARRLEQADCEHRHSFAYCFLDSAGVRGTTYDFPVDAAAAAQFDGKGRAYGTISTAVGVAQATGNLGFVLSRGFSASLNLLSGLAALTKSDTSNGTDKLVATLPVSLVPDGKEAQARFERAILDAFIQAVPGSTHVELETFPLSDGWYATSYILRGGECSYRRCVLASPMWDATCKTPTCDRAPVRSARLVDHAMNGEKVWANQLSWVVLNDPSERKHVWLHSIAAPRHTFTGVDDTVRLYTEVSKHLPAWAGYYLAAQPARGVHTRMVLKGGEAYYFVQPAGPESAGVATK